MLRDARVRYVLFTSEQQWNSERCIDAIKEFGAHGQDGCADAGLRKPEFGQHTHWRHGQTRTDEELQVLHRIRIDVFLNEVSVRRRGS